MTNAGLDYGRGLLNIDHESGIRYGVISQNDVGEAWFEDSEPYYIYTCPDCDAEFKNECPGECSCGHKFNDWDFDGLEPITHYVDDGAYQAECGESGDIFITKSPYFTYAQFCSPCAPGAVYLMNSYTPKGKALEQLTTISKIAPLAYGEAYKSWAEKDGFARGYCFGHDWFESGKAPYPVYRVDTGDLVTDYRGSNQHPQ